MLSRSRSAKLALTATAGVLALAGIASATPLETLTLPPASDPAPLDSNGPNGSPANRVVTVTPTSAGVVKSLKLSGTLNSVNPATFGQEATISITPPGGSPIVLTCFPNEFDFVSLTVTDKQALVTDVVANSGAWTIRFYETFDDGGVGSIDATWADGLTIVLDDAPPVLNLPAATSLGALPVGPSSIVAELDATAVKWYSFTITGAEAANNTFLDIDTEFNPGLDTELGLYDAVGTLIANDDDGGTGFLSQLTFGKGTRCPVSTGFPYDGFFGDLPAGTYYLAVGLYNTTFGPDFAVSSNDGVGATVNVNFNSGVQAPAVAPTPSGTLGSITTTPARFGTQTVTVAAGGVGVLSFSVPELIDFPSRKFFDIDTEGSATLDAVIVVYDATGAIVAGDAGSGSGGNHAALSFGAGYRDAAGPGGQRYTGFSGQLAAGNYFLVIGTPTTWTFAGDFLFCTAGTTGGDVTINFRSGVQPAATAPAATDLGTLTSSNPNAFVTGAALGAADTKWYKFNLAWDTSDPNFFLDIDTEGSSLAPTNDTMIFLYDNAGNIGNFGAGFTFDDDSGSGALSQLTFGNAAPRAAVGNGLAYNNRDGAITAGQYYLAVTGYPTDAFVNDWAVFSNSANAGLFNLTLRTAAGVAPPACLADVNVDGTVDGTDFVLFINSFALGDVAIDSVADVVVDGTIDGNDFVAFINAFALGC